VLAQLAVLTIVISITALIASGWWRPVLSLFAIRPNRMTVDRLGLLVNSGPDLDRVNTILRHFAGGFNAMLTATADARWRAYTETITPLFRPFAEEGLGMGYTPRHLFRFKAADFESRLVKLRPEFRYLYYVGLGFWSGMRNHRVAKLLRITEDLDPLHRFLVFDGYGFKIAFFDHPKNPVALERLAALPGYAQNAAFQGVGRAFYFRFMNDTDRLINAVADLGVHAADAASGIGLASVFVNADRLPVARTMAMRMPELWRAPFHLGMCFALKARAINDLETFDCWLADVEEPVREAAYAAVRECDRIELLVRDEWRSRHAGAAPSVAVDDGYQSWRQRVTDWMNAHIEYPLAGIKSRAGGLNQHWLDGASGIHRVRTGNAASVDPSTSPSPIGGNQR